MTFDGPVVPEATPNPRTIRFVTPPIHDGPSRWYASGDDVDDPRVARLFAASSEIANVLVGPTFVAIGLHRPDAWEELLDAVLRVVTAEFAPIASEPYEVNADTTPRDRETDVRPSEAMRATALDRAWDALRALRPDDPHDLGLILDASSASDSATRQVAARVLIDADAQVAETAWNRLLHDPSRSVRRTTVDAIVDAARPTLRPLLERALADTDAWTRWKALRGLIDLGIEPSLEIVAPLSEDRDFRVRLEVARAVPGNRRP